MNTDRAIADILDRIREERPLIHCLTNGVVKNFTANVLLALGAAPAMIEDPEEAAEFAPLAGGLLVNLGTLDRPQAEAMRKAVRAANDTGTPWVLDPVAVGLLSFRTAFAKELLDASPTLIRGNASEIIALSGHSAQGRGTDSGDTPQAALEAAQALAQATSGAVLATGAIDLVTNGAETRSCANGHPLLTRVTGVGCAQGAIAAACLAVTESPLLAGLAAAVFMGVAGDIAVRRAKRPGNFQVELLDALDELTPKKILIEQRLG